MLSMGTAFITVILTETTMNLVSNSTRNNRDESGVGQPYVNSYPILLNLPLRPSLTIAIKADTSALKIKTFGTMSRDWRHSAYFRMLVNLFGLNDAALNLIVLVPVF